MAIRGTLVAAVTVERAVATAEFPAVAVVPAVRRTVIAPVVPPVVPPVTVTVERRTAVIPPVAATVVTEVTAVTVTAERRTAVVPPVTVAIAVTVERRPPFVVLARLSYLVHRLRLSGY